jgi:hypothetical protein
LFSNKHKKENIELTEQCAALEQQVKVLEQIVLLKETEVAVLIEEKAVLETALEKIPNELYQIRNTKIHNFYRLKGLKNSRDGFDGFFSKYENKLFGYIIKVLNSDDFKNRFEREYYVFQMLE